MYHFQFRKWHTCNYEWYRLYRSYENCKRPGVAILDMQMSKVPIISGYVETDRIQVLTWDRQNSGPDLRQTESTCWLGTNRIQVLTSDRQNPGADLGQTESRSWLETDRIQVLTWDRQNPGADLRQTESRFWVETDRIQVLTWDRQNPGPDSYPEIEGTFLINIHHI